MLDANFGILYGNTHLLDLTGRKREEIIHKSWMEIFVPEDNRAHWKTQLSLLMSNSAEPSRYTEAEIMASDGTRIMFGWNYSVLKSSSGKPIGLTYVGQEITPVAPSILIPPVIKTEPKRIGEYILLKQLENESVQLAVHKQTNQAVVVKFLAKESMNELELERATQQIRAMEGVEDQHIVKLIEYHETNSHFILVEEYIVGTHMASFVRKYFKN
jgi:PAS domain S-box-containing protein